MYSTFQRLNQLASVSTSFVMALLALIALASFYSMPEVDIGRVDVHDLIVQRGRLQRWGAKPEDLASLRFDLKTDLTPLLHSYNTKQLFLYLTASYVDDVTDEAHEVVLWDKIVQRAEMRDFRAVQSPKKPKGKAAARRTRAKFDVQDLRIKYPWHNGDTRSFQNCHYANVTLHYSLQPYVGMVTQGVAATASGLVEIPPVIKR